MQVSLTNIREAFPEFSDLNPAGARGGQKIILQGKWKGQTIALKIVRKSQFIPRIQREIEAIRMLQHPHIPPILDFGIRDIEGHQAFYVVEPWLDGMTLREYLNRYHHVPFSGVLWMAHILFDTVAHLRQKRLVHRDIKPENIMLTETPHLYLLDFGLVRMLDRDSLTQSGLFKGVGSVGYAPPEQFLNLKAAIDDRADLYAVAVVLAESATGIHSYRLENPNPVRIMKLMRHSAIKHLSIEEDPDGLFARLIEDLTQPSPAHRLSDIQVILDRLYAIEKATGIKPEPVRWTDAGAL